MVVREKDGGTSKGGFGTVEAKDVSRRGRGEKDRPATAKRPPRKEPRKKGIRGTAQITRSIRGEKKESNAQRVKNAKVVITHQEKGQSDGGSIKKTKTHKRAQKHGITHGPPQVGKKFD